MPSEFQIDCAGFDIGGANTKLATTFGLAKEIQFPIWKDPNLLSGVLKNLASLLKQNSKVGITMTAELADCFSSKQQGVEFIVDAAEEVLSDFDPMFYLADGRMAAGDFAKSNPELASASNWHALAWMLISDSEFDSGFVIDIGSTTTDIIPVVDGNPVVAPQNDFDRLANGQLVYAGIGRTPICSLLSQIQLADATVGIAREVFATAGDAFRVLGKVESDEVNLDEVNSDENNSSVEAIDFGHMTADGRPPTVEASKARLARMVCAEVLQLGSAGILAIAHQTEAALAELLISNIGRVVDDHPSVPRNFVLAGGGSWLGLDCIRKLQTAWSSKVQTSVFDSSAVQNQCAAALAVAKKRQTLVS